MNWTDVVRKAHECQRTWGMGFPCISIELLEPYRATIEQALAEKKLEVERLKNNDRRYRWLWPRLACLETRLESNGSQSYRFLRHPLDDATWYADLDLAIDECSGFSGTGQAPAFHLPKKTADD